MRDELLTRMIRIYGFEHKCVIEFAKLMENKNFTDEMLAEIVKSHEEFSQIEEEDF